MPAAATASNAFAWHQGRHSPAMAAGSELETEMLILCRVLESILQSIIEQCNFQS